MNRSGLYSFIATVLMTALLMAFGGCRQATASQNPLEPSFLWDGKCLGRAGDEGRELFWNTWWSEREGSTELDKPTTQRVGMKDRRYVCKDHWDGWWFEQAP